MMNTLIPKQRGLPAWVVNLLRHSFLLFTFCFLDFWLRYKTRDIGLYPVTELAPNLLTVLWALLLTSVITLLPSRRAGRIAYGVVYCFFAIYTVAQYIVYMVLGRFIYVTDILLAGEGADYLDYVITFMTPWQLLQLVALAVFGVLGIAFFPKKRERPGKTAIIRGVSAAACVLAISQAALLYGDVPKDTDWDNFENAAYEYQRFASPNFGMQLTGVYQFLNRDIQIQLDRQFADHSEQVETIDSFFEGREHRDNEMTGIFKGKNVIVVMMESIDDWLITPEVMPTLYKMMTEGINFTNLYTAQYSSGYTFNTEFAFNLSVYPYSNGAASYSLTRNTFSGSLASVFAAAGYEANSFHEGEPDFYNRGQMHQAFGYDTYHCYRDYTAPVSVYDDTFLTQCDELYARLTAGEPFCSFVITYTGHLPYDAENFTTVDALAKFPEYAGEEHEELRSLYAKARITDEMFAQLLQRLEEDGLLEDTVIVCYGDHYTYGLSDQELLQQLSEDAGNAILENTPAIVYWAGLEEPVEVTKTCQIIDLAPTVMNLFGLEVPVNIMGSDILDETYSGYAILPYSSWITDEAYVRNGQIQYNYGMTEAQIQEMNAFVQQFYVINDAILDCDYYAK